MRRLHGCLWALLLSGATASAQAAQLPGLNVDLGQTSVSGLSSGGYMAVQFHVAHSAIVKGAGVIAGGPYFCAKDDQNVATTVCSCTGLTSCQPGRAAQAVPDLIQRTTQFAQQNAIDATTNLSADRIWLFAGSVDSVVPPPVMDALATYYANYLPAANIAYVKNIAAEHAMPTDFFGNACNFRGDPFINNCQFDAAGALLQWVYGSLNPKNTGAPSGRLIEFDQAEFLPDPAGHGLWQTGWVYVPSSCEQGAQCRVHVVFHGCKQYPGSPYAPGPQGKFGDTFVRNSGYNRWADTNNLVVLYPQANALTAGTRLPRTNPNGCWDWWGYDDAAYATKSGRQMLAVRKMLERLAGTTTPPPPGGFCGQAANLDHVTANRAYTWFFWMYFARGSNEFLGFSGATPTTLKETTPGTYRKVAACN
ncbi:MAG TPA: PHA-depolymerase-like protein [Burkholderiaceae bacterium]|nr:PHA-depolymerase-like protein [Burkholderiaceae bacterium]